MTGEGVGGWMLSIILALGCSSWLSHCFSSVMPMCNAVCVLYTFQNCKSRRLCRFWHPGCFSRPRPTPASVSALFGVSRVPAQAVGTGEEPGYGFMGSVRGSVNQILVFCNFVLLPSNDGWLCCWTADGCLSLRHAD
jgi:hypothetical protein